MPVNFKSIKFQVLLALSIQAAVLLAVVGVTLYLLQQRQHDYLILNLASQLRIITHSMGKQSLNYIKVAPRDYPAYERDLGLYNKDLQAQVEQFDTIIHALQQRSIPADLVTMEFSAAEAAPDTQAVAGLASGEAVSCSWDEASGTQLEQTALLWQRFVAGLNEALGPDPNEPRLEYAAQYVLDNEQQLTESTIALNRAFRSMMESAHAQIEFLNQAAIAVMLLISLTILFIVYRRVFGPIDTTVAGFKRVASGDLQHQVPVSRDDEIGAMTRNFNYLTERLAAMFRLTDRIGQATNLDETLRFAQEEFRAFLPIDWVGLVRTARAAEVFNIDRYHAQTPVDLDRHEEFNYPDSIFAQVIDRRAPLYLTAGSPAWEREPFLRRLSDNHLHSVFLMPLTGSKLDTAMLIFAAERADAYNKDHLEFLGNIAGQVGHSFDKTVGMESLVISTIEGLAKLAESRDPETGDHLFRMSHYSAILAEELANTEPYRQLANPQYVRDIFQFAPMHDIGKVGINDAVLLKPGRLDEQEFKHMQQHPIIGGNVLRRCEQQVNAVGLSLFQVGIEIAEGHHEKFDGSGYPHGMSGAEIPLSARIIAVADVFDALTSKRPYKNAWPVDRALQTMRSQAGQHFDPDIIAALQRALPRILQIYNQYKHV